MHGRHQRRAGGLQPGELEPRSVGLEGPEVAHEPARAARLARVLDHQQVAAAVGEELGHQLSHVGGGAHELGAAGELAARLDDGVPDGGGEAGERHVGQERVGLVELPARLLQLGRGLAERRRRDRAGVGDTGDAGAGPPDPLGRARERLAGVGGQDGGVGQGVHGVDVVADHRQPARDHGARVGGERGRGSRGVVGVVEGGGRVGDPPLQQGVGAQLEVVPSVRQVPRAEAAT